MPAEATSPAETDGPHSCTSPREGPGDGPSSTVRLATHGLTQPLPIPGPLRDAARPTQPLEPILVPKLRIRFADFPYLHCSTDQRLLTLETCCGYGYGLERESLARGPRANRYITHSHFQGPAQALRTPQEPWCF